MSYSEFRVRTAFDELVFQWATDGCVGEEYDAFLEVLHDEDGYDIYDVLENHLGEELQEDMEDGDWEELIRRLKNMYPQKEDDEETVDEEEDDDEVYLHGEPIRAATETETPAQFEARRARIWRAFEGLMSPREIRAIVRNTRR